MEKVALNARKNPLTTKKGIVFSVAGVIFLLPYLMVSAPTLMTFFISLFKVFANLFTLKFSLAFANLTPLLSSFLDAVQCFVGPLSMLMVFIMLVSGNEEKASIFAVLNLIATVITLVSGKVSVLTPAWAVSLLADIVLAFALLAYSLCEGKIITSTRWIWFAAIFCEIRIISMLFAAYNGSQLFMAEYYPAYDYEAFVASYRQFVTAVLNKKNVSTELSLSSYSFNFENFAQSWKGYIADVTALDTLPRNAVNHFDFPRTVAKGVANVFSKKPMLTEILYVFSSRLVVIFGFLMLRDTIKADRA